MNHPVTTIKDILRMHYIRMRQNPLFRDTTLLYCPENNLGSEHGWVADYIMDPNPAVNIFKNVYVLSEKDDKLGFRTDKASKLSRAMLLYKSFMMGQIAMCKDIVTVNPKRSQAEEADKLVTQIGWLREYRRRGISEEETEVTALFTSDRKRIPQRKDDGVQSLEVALDAMDKWYLGQLPSSQYTAVKKMQRQAHGEHNIQTSYVRKRALYFGNEEDGGDDVGPNKRYKPLM
jgi:hypothetical protein